MFLLILSIIFNLFMVYLISICPWLLVYFPMRHEKSFKQLLKETKYIPIIPVVNLLILLFGLLYWIYDDIKNKKECRLGYVIGFSIIILSVILLLKTHQWYWIFLVPVYCTIWEIIDVKKKLVKQIN